MIVKKKIFLYDCFNTILLETEAVNCWNNTLGKYLGIEGNLVKRLRKQSEIIVSRRSEVGEYSFDDMLKNFFQRYESLVEYASVKSFSEFHDIAYITEINDLKRKTRLNTKLVTEIEHKRADGCQIIVLSDFYLGKQVLSELIEDKLIKGSDLFDEIIVSCDINANKSSGTAYMYLIDTLGVDPAACYMTGDNLRSDYLNAIAKGFGARWYRN